MTREKKNKYAKMCAFCDEYMREYFDPDVIDLESYQDYMDIYDIYIYGMLDGLHDVVTVETDSDYDMARRAIMQSCKNVYYAML